MNNNLFFKRIISLITIASMLCAVIFVNIMYIEDVYAVTYGVNVLDMKKVAFKEDSGDIRVNIQQGDIWLGELIAEADTPIEMNSDSLLEIIEDTGRVMDARIYDMDYNVENSTAFSKEAVFFEEVDNISHEYNNMKFNDGSLASYNRTIIKPVVVENGKNIKLEIENEEYIESEEGFYWCKLVKCEGKRKYINESSEKEIYSYEYYKVEDVIKGAEGSFNLVNVEDEDMAVYVCTTLKNGESDKIVGMYNVCSKSILNVRANKDVMYVKEGEKTSLNVDILETATNQINVKWYKDGKDIGYSGNPYNISKVTEADYGNYTAVVTDGDSLPQSVNITLKRMDNDALTQEVKERARNITTYVSCLETTGSNKGMLVKGEVHLSTSITANTKKVWTYVKDKDDANCEDIRANLSESDILGDSIKNQVDLVDNSSELYGGNKIVKCYGIPMELYKEDKKVIEYTNMINNSSSEDEKDKAKIELLDYELTLLDKASYVETFIFKDKTDMYNMHVKEIKGTQDLLFSVPRLEGVREYRWNVNGKSIENNSSTYIIYNANIMDCGMISCEIYGCVDEEVCLEGTCTHDTLMAREMYNLVYASDMTSEATKNYKASIGQDITLTASAKSSLQLNYKWYDDEGNVLSEEAECVVKNFQKENFTQYLNGNKDIPVTNYYKCVIMDGFNKKECVYTIDEMVFEEVTSKFKNVVKKNTSIRFSWEPVKNATGYRIYQLDFANKKYNVVSKSQVSNTFFAEGLNSGTAYRFAVKAYKIEGGKVYMSPYFLALNTTTAPGKTSKIKIGRGYTSIKLTWNKVTGATGYRVYIAQNGKWVRIRKSGASNIYIKTRLKKGAKYKFAVKAYTIINGEVIWSNTFTTVNTSTVK